MSRGAPFGPDDGTIAPWAMLATLPFDPDAALPGTRHLLATYPQVCTNDRSPAALMQRCKRGAWLAVRGMVRTRSGIAGHDDRKLSHGFDLEYDARCPVDPQRVDRCGLRRAGGCSDGTRRSNRTVRLERKIFCAEFARRVENPGPQSRYDLVIVGGGPAGLSAAEFARRQGRSVALVERFRLGGNSLNSGSIPSKAIIRAARLSPLCATKRNMARRRSNGPLTDFAGRDGAHAANTYAHRGISFPRATAALKALMSFSATPASWPLTCCSRGRLRYRSERRSSPPVRGPDRPNIPGSIKSGISPAIRFSISPNCRSGLGVIGGGPLGCELAQAFCRLGSQVTIVQNEPKFLPRRRARCGRVSVDVDCRATAWKHA